MPYDFVFNRTNKLENIVALEENRKLAKVLTDSFQEIYDSNHIESEYHFSNIKIDNKKEFPENHFQLFADIGDVCFIFSFWKDSLFIEFGSGHDSKWIFSIVNLNNS